jgi:major type 1 subunit fimbrin (pilin)
VNIQIKRALLAAGVATAMGLPLSSQASDGTITFTGAVTANTCTLNVNGSGNADGAVTLPIVSVSALTNATASKTSAAGTFFNIKISGCTATNTDVNGHAPTTVQVYFEAGPNVDVLTGGLINGGTSNVEVNLYNASGTTVVGTQIVPGTNTNLPAALPVGATSTQWYYAGYSTGKGTQSPNGNSAGVTVAAGTVNTSVTYSITYQ